MALVIYIMVHFSKEIKKQRKVSESSRKRESITQTMEREKMRLEKELQLQKIPMWIMVTL